MLDTEQKNGFHRYGDSETLNLHSRDAAIIWSNLVLKYCVL